MLLIDKTKQDLINTAIQRMAENTNINGINVGDVARKFLDVICEIMEEKYNTLKTSHLNAFLSTATGDALDLIGYLVACARKPEEGDDDYRYRISKQVLTIANANQTAVRLAALSANGVKDVILQPFTHGTGSFSVFVVTDDPYASDSILYEVKDKLEEVKAYGIRVEVFKPKVIPVQLKAKIIYNNSVSEYEKTTISARATEKVRDYINSLFPGESFVIYEIAQKIMEIDPRIYDIEFIEIRVNKRKALIVNQKSKWNERFFEDRVPRAIEVA